MTDSDVIDVVEFSGFRLDRGRRRLTGPDGDAVALTSKAFDTLSYLVANPGRVVDKQELLDAVWPGVAVEENTLNHAISAVRRALGDCRNEPRFIATIQGRGYQLVAPVQAAGAQAWRDSGSDTRVTPSAESSAGAAKPLGRFGGGSLALGMTIGVLILAAALLALTGYPPGSRFSNPETAIEYQVGRTVWVTRDSTLELDPVMSADGRFIAYAEGSIGQTDIVVRDVITDQTENLTEGLPGAHGWPRWSPDSEQIAFRTVLPRSFDIIHVVPARGGDVQAVVRQPFMTGHDWSPTGPEIV